MQSAISERIDAEQQIKPKPQRSQIADSRFARGKFELGHANGRQLDKSSMSNVAVNRDYRLQALPWQT